MKRETGTTATGWVEVSRVQMQPAPVPWRVYLRVMVGGGEESICLGYFESQPQAMSRADSWGSALRVQVRVEGGLTDEPPSLQDPQR